MTASRCPQKGRPSTLLFKIISSALLMHRASSFAPSNKYLVPSDQPGPGCYDVFNFSNGRQVASSFSLEINDVGPGTPFPDETVIMSFSQITIINNFYSNDMSNFNVSLYNSDPAGTVPTVEISKANLLVNEGCNNNAPSWAQGSQVCLITVYFPVPYPRIGPFRPFPDKNQYWIVVSFEGQYNPTQVQELQWPLLCMVRTGESYNPNIPVVAINQDRYDYRVDSTSSWLPFRSDYMSGGIYYSLFGPQPSPSATKSSSATRLISAAATSSASLSALASQSAASSSSATQSAISSTANTPSNSNNRSAISSTSSSSATFTSSSSSSATSSSSSSATATYSSSASATISITMSPSSTITLASPPSALAANAFVFEVTAGIAISGSIVGSLIGFSIYRWFLGRMQPKDSAASINSVKLAGESLLYSS
jgi:hypothetical protein